MAPRSVPVLPFSFFFFLTPIAAAAFPCLQALASFPFVNNLFPPPPFFPSFEFSLPRKGFASFPRFWCSQLSLPSFLSSHRHGALPLFLAVLEPCRGHGPGCLVSPHPFSVFFSFPHASVDSRPAPSPHFSLQALHSFFADLGGSCSTAPGSRVLTILGDGALLCSLLFSFRWAFCFEPPSWRQRLCRNSKRRFVFFLISFFFYQAYSFPGCFAVSPLTLHFPHSLSGFLSRIVCWEGLIFFPFSFLLDSSLPMVRREPAHFSFPPVGFWAHHFSFSTPPFDFFLCAEILLPLKFVLRFYRQAIFYKPPLCSLGEFFFLSRDIPSLLPFGSRSRDA